MSIYQNKIYLCQLDDQEMAARLYDIAIIQNKGLHATTNFNYTKS